ncbi:YdcF family protein [Komarekiella sp. 'clone 1']|uniref:YdcF family protein n=2 Tax=Komarekiella TaxID=2022127 RepID=A0AA40SSN5_9NOST|nr:YdcF family protein [Komarekiella delphini-convector SJRDD-AB1]
MNKLLFTGKTFRFMALVLPLAMWWGYKEVQNQFVQPQAVLVLGGSTRRLEREKFTAQFARKHPNIPIWITGGSPPKSTQRVFTKAGIDPKRLHLDYQAVDTVTNFTTLVDDLQARGINSVYLITSDFHMRRACVIGEIILGSRGIELKPVPVPSEKSPEPIEKSIRDGVRAILWVATGYTGTDEAQHK